MKLFATVLVFFFHFSIFAQMSPVGGPNGSALCTSLYAGEDFLLAGVAYDLYRSSDAGQTWTQITNGIPEDVAVDVIIGMPDVIIIGTNNNDRCYRSTDDGLSWTPIVEGLPEIFGTPAAVPEHGCTHNGKFYMSGTNFIRRSSDLGLTWETMSIDGLNYGIRVVGNEIWAAPNSAINFSSDDGETWTATDAVPTIGFGTSATCFLEVGDKIWVGTNMAGGQGLSYTSDHGATYQDNNSISLVEDLAFIDGSIYCTAYDGLWRSTDLGETWTNVMPLTLGATKGQIVAYEGMVWFASSMGPLQYNPLTEEVYYPGFPGAQILDMVQGNNVIMASSGGSLFSSINEGASWVNITANINPGAYIEELHFADGKFYALAGAFNLHYMYISDDDGATWTQYQFDNPNDTFSSMITAGNIIASSYTNFVTKLWYSNDGGENFIAATAPGIGLVNDVISFHVTESKVFANLTQGYAWSDDEGQNWTFVPGLIAGGQTVIGGWDNRLIGLFVLDFFVNIAYRESLDGGETWTDMMTGLPAFTGVYQIRKMYTLGDRVYIQINLFDGDPAGKIYSIGQSGNWVEESSLGAIPHDITCMFEMEDGIFYAGTMNAGVWSNNTGIPASSDELKLDNSLFAFPNPASDYLMVQCENQGMLTMYNLHGQLVKSEYLNNSINSIDITHLSPGLYIATMNGKSMKIVVE